MNKSSLMLKVERKKANIMIKCNKITFLLTKIKHVVAVKDTTVSEEEVLNWMRMIESNLTSEVNLMLDNLRDFLIDKVNQDKIGGEFVQKQAIFLTEYDIHMSELESQITIVSATLSREEQQE